MYRPLNAIVTSRVLKEISKLCRKSLDRLRLPMNHNLHHLRTWNHYVNNFRYFSKNFIIISTSTFFDTVLNIRTHWHVLLYIYFRCFKFLLKLQNAYVYMTYLVTPKDLAISSNQGLPLQINGHVLGEVKEIFYPTIIDIDQIALWRKNKVTYYSKFSISSVFVCDNTIKLRIDFVTYN